jgi:hypothetical protein
MFDVIDHSAVSPHDILEWLAGVDLGSVTLIATLYTGIIHTKRYGCVTRIVCRVSW